MFKELLAILRGDTPLNETTADFERMLALAQDMVLEASEIFWGASNAGARLDALRRKDVAVNKLERTIRKRAATHLSLSERKHDVPYNLLMMSLVKDVERLGDYAKNLAEAGALIEAPFPPGPQRDELRAIRDSVEAFVKEAAVVLTASNSQRAVELTEQHRSVAKRCDALLRDLAHSDMQAAHAVTMTLGARYYKRIDGHLLNLVSSVIMPLHKLDYFDEDFLDGQEARDAD